MSEQRPTATHPMIVLVLVGLAQFMVVLDATITNVALPAIQEDLRFTPENLQWVVNSYTLVFGGFLLLGGRAADLIGRKRLFLIGIAVFTIASLLNGIAQSEGMLIASRALQGLGAAFVSPAALAILTTTFKEGPERTRAMAVWAAIAAGGAAAGLLLGGILTDLVNWRWIFLINVPVGLATIFLSARLVPESRPDVRPSTFDAAGALSVTAGLVLVVYAIVGVQDQGWGSAQTLLIGGGGLLLLAAFIFTELRTREPLIRLSIFRIRSLAISNSTMLVVAGGMFSMFYFLSIFMQQVVGYSAIETGLAFLPFTFGIVVGSVIAQNLVPKIGAKWETVIGLVLGTAGLALFSQVPDDPTYVVHILPAMVLMSLGMGNVFVPITLMATTNVDGDDAGLASGLFNTSQQVGGALGLAILSTFATGRTEDRVATGTGQVPALVDGFQLAFAIGAGLLALGVVLVVALIRKRDIEKIAEAAAEGEILVPA